MKKVEMYADDDGRVWASPREAQQADWEIYLRELVRSLSGVDARRETLKTAFMYLIEQKQINLWQLTKKLLHLRKMRTALQQPDEVEMPF